MFKEYYAISDNEEKRFIIMQDDETGKVAILKTVKPEIIECLKNIDFEKTNLPRIYEFGANYVIEEQIEGEKLSEKIEHGLVSLDEIISIISDVGNAVGKLHNVGLAHMDIAPENIIESGKGYIIIDYSASVKIGSKATNISYGTPMFCSPEHFGFDKVSKASDVYSMGKLLDYLLQINCTEKQRSFFVELIKGATKVSQKGRIANVDEFLKKFENVCQRHTECERFEDTLLLEQRGEEITFVSTQDIFNSMDTLNDLADFLRKNENNFIKNSVEDYFEQLLKNKKLKKTDIVKNSGIERTYAYQLLNGTKKPSRDKLIALCIGACLTFEEVQMALKHTGFMPLYPKVRRDAIIIYGIKAKKKIWEIDELLYRFKESILNEVK